ncbi:MAG: hypothetical protein J5725_04280 [Bacteroidales bacterium]|nr:hypothetical protein [Bacteroidales bacterium]
MKRYAPKYVNTIAKKIVDGDVTCFILKTSGEPDYGYWYWVVNNSDLEAYKGSDAKFVNDPRNDTVGSSCASFATVEEAEQDFLS